MHFFSINVQSVSIVVLLICYVIVVCSYIITGQRVTIIMYTFIFSIYTFSYDLSNIEELIDLHLCIANVKMFWSVKPLPKKNFVGMTNSFITQVGIM